MVKTVNELLDWTKTHMDKAIEHLENELQKVRAGKASPQMLDSVHVDYYGTPTSLIQVAAVNTPDAKTIVITPWEKSMIKPIEKAIIDANLGFTPQDDGALIRINLPALTEERRKQLVKMAKDQTEHAKIAIRNIRKDGMENAKKLVKDGLPEDEGKVCETKIQEHTDKYIQKTDEILKFKEKDILTV